MNGDIGMLIQILQLWVLLFIDLCDLLILVECIGDSVVVELFQQYDCLVLILQQQWNGYQIDCFDGLFLFFECVIDVFGFVLDYQCGLQQIGEECGIVLCVCFGFYVGEVLIWENSFEVIKVGVKLFEVEGLVKLMVVCLMMLVCFGQILLLVVVELLIYCVIGELGECGECLLWKLYGCWCFKGVLIIQEVFEVGEIGFVLLCMLCGNVKVCCDILLWWQLFVLVVEVLLVVVLVLGGWMLLWLELVIVFVECDWVVVGDVNNFIGNVLFDDSLQQVFWISLEQLCFVNVFSDMKVCDMLIWMWCVFDVCFDWCFVLEVVVWDGVCVIILLLVLEVYGKLCVLVEVVDLVSGEMVYFDYVDGCGLELVLVFIDYVVVSLCGCLGEVFQDIDCILVLFLEVVIVNLDVFNVYVKGLVVYG